MSPLLPLPQRTHDSNVPFGSGQALQVRDAGPLLAKASSLLAARGYMPSAAPNPTPAPSPYAPTPYAHTPRPMDAAAAPPALGPQWGHSPPLQQAAAPPAQYLPPQHSSQQESKRDTGAAERRPLPASLQPSGFADPVARSRAVLEAANAVAQRRMQALNSRVAEQNSRAAAAAAAEAAQQEQQRHAATQQAAEEARGAALLRAEADHQAAAEEARGVEAAILLRSLNTRMQQAERQLQDMQGRHSAARTKLQSVVDYTHQLLQQVQGTRGVWARAPPSAQDSLMQALQHVLQLMESVQSDTPPSSPPQPLSPKHIQQAKRTSEKSQASTAKSTGQAMGKQGKASRAADPPSKPLAASAREQAFDRGAWSGLFLSSAVQQDAPQAAQVQQSTHKEYSSPPAAVQRSSAPVPPPAGTPPRTARRLHAPGEVASPPSAAVASLLSPESNAYAELAAIDERLANIGARVQRVQRGNLVRGLQLRKGGRVSPRREHRPQASNSPAV